ncbi:MAG TPA: amidohydrolase family protein, partial [Candidatus Thermoplasmatota archaeon]|nr:amidohydrolase family protein [Candidatus Thermoplasmatota archaeon]
QAAWFTGDDDRKGMLREGLLADVAVLDQDYFSVPDDKVPQIQSLVTIAGGKIVHAVDPWADLAPPILVMKDTWLPGQVPPLEDIPLAVIAGLRDGC